MENNTASSAIAELAGPASYSSEHHFVASVSPAMHSIERTINDIADTDIPVLLFGESGTGKSALAWKIHQLSSRRCEPFTRINCALLTPEALVGQLQNALGEPNHGAFNGGTTFLDEIGELDLSSQRKLLNVLPDGKAYQPVYGRSVRMISSTRCNLEKDVHAGRFREDLFFRLNGVCLRLPLLRQRKEDIPLLTDHFLSKYAAEFGKPKPEVSGRTTARFLEYSWPGNLRELEHTVQKIVALGDEQRALADLCTLQLISSKSAVRGGISLKRAAREASRQAERELILKVLVQTRWNRKLAAQQLQISYKALLYKLKQIGLDSEAR